MHKKLSYLFFSDLHNLEVYDKVVMTKEEIEKKTWL